MERRLKNKMALHTWLPHCNSDGRETKKRAARVTKSSFRASNSTTPELRSSGDLNLRFFRRKAPRTENNRDLTSQQHERGALVKLDERKDRDSGGDSTDENRGNRGLKSARAPLQLINHVIPRKLYLIPKATPATIAYPRKKASLMREARNYFPRVRLRL